MTSKFRKLAEGFWVSPQLAEKDVEQAAAMGVRLIINNRPDGEEAGQPPAADIEQAARRLGIEFVSIPFSRANVTDEQIREFEAATASANGPVLAYCRSGTRSTIIRALALAHARRNVAAIISEAEAAGYDISGLTPRLEALARSTE